MANTPTGVIFAGLDCDIDSLESWNRWYDLEHVPPNVAMPGVQVGHRYVATPKLHGLRRVAPESGFAANRGLFVTIYTLCEPAMGVFESMTTLRDKLYAQHRMNFPPDKKVVREGDVFQLEGTACTPTLALPADEVPFIGHHGLLIIQRRGSAAVKAWYRGEWAPRVVGLHGVHAVMQLTSLTRDGLDMDLVFLEGDLATGTQLVRHSVGHHADAQIVLDSPFQLIQPLSYPWAEDLRASDLPRTIA